MTHKLRSAILMTVVAMLTACWMSLLGQVLTGSISGTVKRSPGRGSKRRSSESNPVGQSYLYHQLR
jgi:hypothetical protein